MTLPHQENISDKQHCKIYLGNLGEGGNVFIVEIFLQLDTLAIWLSIKAVKQIKVNFFASLKEWVYD